MVINKEEILIRNNISIIGSADKTLLLAHGFGCDQSMWRFMLPELQSRFKVILFDYVGCGGSDLSAFSHVRYSNLEGYAKDIEEIITTLDLKNVSVICHSVSSIIAGIASTNLITRMSDITMICPSPCFINNPPDYIGGFEKQDLMELINLMDKNYIGWANQLSPLVMGATNAPELIGELSGSFCSTDPIFAKAFAKATFFSDYRKFLTQIQTPSLIVQSSDDSLAPVKVGEYMFDNIPNCELKIIEAAGHCLHMTAPNLIVPKIINFINRNLPQV